MEDLARTANFGGTMTTSKICIFFICSMTESFSFSFSSLYQERDGDMKQLAKELSSLSINDCSLPGIKPEDKNKLADLLKTRSIMQFNLSSRGGGDLTSLFSPEELTLLQDIPKGTLLELKNSYLLVT